MGLIGKLMGGRAGMVLGAVMLLLASPLVAPQLLAFPHKTKTPIGTVWSEQPLDPALMAATVSAVRQRLATSPLAKPDESRPIFLTNGGWRWLYLANTTRSAFAFTRPITPAVVVNQTVPSDGAVRNGASIGGVRPLAAVLAHEFTHGMIRRKYGVIRSATFPQWKVEGYCDHVAGNSSLSEADVAILEAEGRAHPALPYFHGRKRVAAVLAANGGSPDTLFIGDQ